MPSGSYCQSYVNCPFYKTDNGKNKITCEGAIPDTVCEIKFEGKEAFDIQMTAFCFDRYTYCEQHAAARRKYEEENKDV